MSAAPILPAITRQHGVTVLTFPASATGFASRHAAEDWLKARGFSVGSWQDGAPAGIAYGKTSISKWRGLTALDKMKLHGRMEAPGSTGRSGPIIVSLFSSAPAEAHFEIVRTVPMPSRPAAIERGLLAAGAGFAACLVVLGLLLFLPRPIAARPQHHSDVDELFRAPKIGLRAEALRARDVTEARR